MTIHETPNIDDILRKHERRFPNNCKHDDSNLIIISTDLWIYHLCGVCNKGLEILEHLKIAFPEEHFKQEL